MDNLRPLSRSLPRPSSTRAKEPPEAVLQAFKEAAHSVTKLYKEAAASHTRARQAGYQDALDDLLAFLDREDLGLDDGEGWRVRQWATKRLDTSDRRPNRADDDREESDSERDVPAAAAAPAAADRTTETEPRTLRRAEEDSSPVLPSSRLSVHETASHPSPKKASLPQPSSRQQLQQQQAASPVESTTTSPTKQPSHTSSNPLSPSSSTPSGTHVPNLQGTFTFRAPAPSGIMDTDEPEGTTTTTASAPTTTPTPAAIHSVRPTARRKGHMSSSNRWNSSNPSASRERLGMGLGAGAKRKFAMADYFDFAGLGVKDWTSFGRDGSDGNGGAGGNGGGGGGGGGLSGGGREAKKGRLG